jgi:hypothetical protein
MTVLDLENRQEAKAPGSAFSFESGQLESRGSTLGGSAPIRMLARTGGALQHAYWGRIVHDFAGMEHRDSIPIDYQHESGDPIGYVDSFEVVNGDLYLSGSLESIEENDVAHKLMQKRERKIPFQASIFFDPNDLELEFLPEGMTAEVNERTIEGPAVIASKWRLRGVAVTPHGYDVGTESEFSAPAGAFSLTWKGEPMTKKDAKPEAEKTADDSGELNTEPKAKEDPKPTELSKPTEKDYRDLAKDYASKFGAEDGFSYFSEGLNLEQAALKHCETLQGKLTAETERADSAEQRLAAAELNLGEKSAVETGKPEAKSTPTFAGMFRKQGSSSQAS